MKTQLINDLDEFKKRVMDFKLICRRYKKGHNYHKEKLKSLKLNANKILKLNNVPNEIEILIKNFLENKEKDTKTCKEFIDILDEKKQNLEIEIEKNKEGFSERYYGKKSPFKFHLDIKEIIENSNEEIFIIEPFVTDHILELTLKDLNRKRKIRILTNSKNADKRGKFSKLSNLFKKEFSDYEVRESEEIHDRGIFIDKKEGWILGQSIKDAANNKPTYLVKLRNAKPLESIYHSIWNSSKKIS